jgi:hypothetical protein
MTPAPRLFDKLRLLARLVEAARHVLQDLAPTSTVAQRRARALRQVLVEIDKHEGRCLPMTRVKRAR